MRTGRMSGCFALGAWIGLVTLLLVGPYPSLSFAQEKTLLRADWVLYGYHAPYVVAIRQGFFKEEGLDVTFERGFGSGDTVKVVGLGQADFGVASMGPLIIGRVRGVTTKQIAIQGHKFVQGIYYLKGSGITKPKDFEGKRMGGPVGSADHLMLPVFCKAANLNCDSIRWIPMEGATKVPALMTGQVDAMPDFHTVRPQYEGAARAAGKELSFMLYADWGVDIYSHGNVTSDDTLKKRPQTVQKFLNAVLRAWNWSYQNPDAAIDDFLKQVPEVNRDISRRSLEVTFFHLFDGISEKQGIGVMDREKVKRTIEVTLVSSKIQATVNPEEVFTNEFASRVPERWRFPKGKP